MIAQVVSGSIDGRPLRSTEAIIGGSASDNASGDDDDNGDVEDRVT